MADRYNPFEKEQEVTTGGQTAGTQPTSDMREHYDRRHKLLYEGAQNLYGKDFMSYDEFLFNLSDEDKRRNLYDNITKKKPMKKVKNYDEFSTFLGYTTNNKEQRDRELAQQLQAAQQSTSAATETPAVDTRREYENAKRRTENLEALMNDEVYSARKATGYAPFRYAPGHGGSSSDDDRRNEERIFNGSPGWRTAPDIEQPSMAAPTTPTQEQPKQPVDPTSFEGVLGEVVSEAESRNADYTQRVDTFNQRVDTLNKMQDTLKAKYPKGWMPKTKEEEERYNREIAAFNREVKAINKESEALNATGAELGKGIGGDARLQAVNPNSARYAANGGWTYAQELELNELEENARAEREGNIKAGKKPEGALTEKYRKRICEITGIADPDEAEQAWRDYGSMQTVKKMEGPAMSMLERYNGLAAQERSNFHPYIGMGMGPIQTNSVTGDMYSAAASMTERAIKLMEEYKTYDSQRGQSAAGNFGSELANVGRGFGHTITDLSTWDFGLSSLRENGFLLKAADKSDNDKPLSEAEQAVLDAAAMQMAIQSSIDTGIGFKAGQVTADAIPFMIQMCVSPEAMFGNAVGSKVARYAMKKIGGKLATNAVGKVARIGIKHGIKGMAQIAANEVRGNMMALGPMQIATTMGGVAGRGVDNVQGGLDENGDWHADVVQMSDKSFYSNLWRGIAGQGEENASEFFGDTILDNFMNVASWGLRRSRFGRGLGQLVGKITPTRASEFFGRMSSSTYYKTIQELRKRSHLSGVWGETGEEVWGGAMKALFDVEGRLTSGYNENGQWEQGVFSWDNYKETFITMLPMQVMFGALGMGGYGVQKADARSKMSDARGRLDVALGDFAPEAIAKIDKMPEESFGEELGKLIESGGYNNEQKSAMVRYAAAVQYYRGLDAAASQDMAHNLEEKVFGAAYDEGYKTTDQTERENLGTIAAMDNESLVATFTTMEAEGNNNVDYYLELIRQGRYGDVLAQMQEDGCSEGERRIVEHYITSSQKRNGALDALTHETVERVSAEIARIEGIKDMASGNVREVQTPTGEHGYITNSANGMAWVKKDDDTSEMLAESALTILSERSAEEVENEAAGAIWSQHQEAVNNLWGEADDLKMNDTLDFGDGREARVIAVDAASGMATIAAANGEQKQVPIDYRQQQMDAERFARPGVQEVYQKRVAESEALKQYYFKDDKENWGYEGESRENGRLVVDTSKGRESYYVRGQQQPSTDATETPSPSPDNGPSPEESPTGGENAPQPQPQGKQELSPDIQTLLEGGVVPYNDGTATYWLHLDPNGTVGDGKYIVEFCNDAEATDVAATEEMTLPQVDAMLHPVNEQGETAEEAAEREAKEKEEAEKAAKEEEERKRKEEEERRKAEEEARRKEEEEKRKAEEEAKRLADLEEAAYQEGLEKWRESGKNFITKLRDNYQAAIDRGEISDDTIVTYQGYIRAINELLERFKDEDVPDWTNDTAKAARERGYRMVNGRRVDRHGILPNSQDRIGNQTDVKFSTKVGDQKQAVFYLVEADELVPSHVGGTRNPEYFINEAQPKDRVDSASNIAMRQIANNINPEEITGGVTAYTGSPVVNERGEVIQGNNRSEALRNMTDESKQKYRDYLLANAERFGLDRSDIEKMQNPILVRMIEDITDDEAIRLGQMNAQDTESGGKQTINPQTFLKKLGDKFGGFLRILMQSDEDDNLSLAELISANGFEALKWAATQGALNDTQLQSALENGVLTPEAKKAITDTVNLILFEGGSDTLPTKFKALPQSSQRGILSVISREIGLTPEQSLRGYIQEAIEAYYEAKKGNTIPKDYEGALKKIKSVNQETDAFETPRKFSNFALEIAARLASDTQKTLTARLNKYYDNILGTGADLFNPNSTPKGMVEAFIDAFEPTLTIEEDGDRQPTSGPGSTGGNQGSQGGGSAGQGDAGPVEPSQPGGGPASDGAAAQGVGGEEPTEAEIDALLMPLLGKSWPVLATKISATYPSINSLDARQMALDFIERHKNDKPIDNEPSGNDEGGEGGEGSASAITDEMIDSIPDDAIEPAIKQLAKDYIGGKETMFTTIAYQRVEQWLVQNGKIKPVEEAPADEGNKEQRNEPKAKNNGEGNEGDEGNNETPEEPTTPTTPTEPTGPTNESDGSIFDDPDIKKDFGDFMDALDGFSYKVKVDPNRLSAFILPPVVTQNLEQFAKLTASLIKMAYHLVRKKGVRTLERFFEIANQAIGKPTVEKLKASKDWVEQWIKSVWDENYTDPSSGETKTISEWAKEADEADAAAQEPNNGSNGTDVLLGGGNSTGADNSGPSRGTEMGRPGEQPQGSGRAVGGGRGAEGGGREKAGSGPAAARGNEGSGRNQGAGGPAADGVRGAGGTGPGRSEGADAGGNRGGNVGDSRRLGEQREQKKAQLGDERTKYVPKSRAKSMDVVMPTGMIDAVNKALNAVENEYGPIDEFVMKELGYTNAEELTDAFLAEQIDGIALALYQLKKGKGFVIGDMGGIGKGRQAAAMIRWARMQGEKPIYFTKSDDNFNDVYRDLKDIGSGHLRPFIINGAMTGDKKGNPSKSAGITEVYTDKKGEQKTRVVYGLPSKEEVDQFVATGVLPDGYDYVLCTYSQFNNADPQSIYEATGDKEQIEKDANGNPIYVDSLGKRPKLKEASWKAKVLRRHAASNYLIMDECHMAAGKGKTGTFFRSIMRGDKRSTVNPRGVVFASATFAKNAESMPLYASMTAIGDANVSANDLIEIVSKGGVVMQELLSRGLSQSGQSIRRERDMRVAGEDGASESEGVKRSVKTITDTDKIDKIRTAYDHVASMIRNLIQFQNNYIQPYLNTADLSADVKSSGLPVTDKTTNYVYKYSAEAVAVSFARKIRQINDALLFAAKADAVADEVIEQIKQGKHPVISFDSTMESTLAAIAEIGDELDSNDFAQVIGRYIPKLFDYEVKIKESASGKKDRKKDNKKRAKNGLPETPDVSPVTIQKKLKLEDMPDEVKTEYERLMGELKRLSTGLPISPVDHIIERLQAAGYKVGEYSGRKSRLVTTKDMFGEKAKRVAYAKPKNEVLIDGFNNGTIDVLLINKSGSTGISLHASSKFDDKRPRIMIEAQMLKDIAEQAQMEWRIDRTGQVHRGEYAVYLSPIPAEARLLMMNEKKLRSLNASTTTSQETGNADDADILNKYGSRVIKEYLQENPGILDDLMLNTDLATTITEGTENPTDGELAATVLRAASFLPCHLQEQFLRDVLDRYRILIDNLNEAGENDLVSNVVKLRAKTTQRRLFSKGVDPRSGNVFAEDAFVDEVEADVLRKPYKRKELEAAKEKVLSDMFPSKEDYESAKNAGTAEKEAMGILRQKIQDEKTRQELSAEKAFKTAMMNRKKAEITGEATLRNMKDEYGMPRWTEEEVKQKVSEALKKDPKTNLAEIQKRKDNSIRLAQDKASALEKNVDELKIGQAVSIPKVLMEDYPVSFEEYTSVGYFLGYKTGKKTASASNTFAVFAVADGRKRIEIPLTEMRKILTIVTQTNMNLGNQLDTLSHETWESRTTNVSREKRYIVTGNIIQGIDRASKLSDNKGRGKLITYTDIDGNVKYGYLLPTIFQESDAKAFVDISERDDVVRNGHVLRGYIDGDYVLEIYEENGYAVVRFDKAKHSGAVKTKLEDYTGMAANYSGGEYRFEYTMSDLKGMLNALDSLNVKAEDASTEQNYDDEGYPIDDDGNRVPVTKKAPKPVNPLTIIPDDVSQQPRISQGIINPRLPMNRQDVKEYIEKNTNNPLVLAIFQKVWPIFLRTGCTFGNFSEPSVNGAMTMAHFHPAKNAIEINLEAWDSVKDKTDEDWAQIFTHEIIHACTTFVLGAVVRKQQYDAGKLKNINKSWRKLYESLTEDQLRAAEELQNILEQIGGHPEFDKLTDVNDKYGMTNINEMVAEMSNPKFVAVTKAIGLWKRFVNAIKRLLNIESATDKQAQKAGLTKTDAYTEIEDALDRILASFTEDQYQMYVEAANGVDEYEVYAHKITDESLINELEKGPKETGYRNVVTNEDGSMGSPMANRLGKTGAERKATTPFGMNEWEQADEHPELADERGKINLIKPDGKPVDGVDYNPYIHIRPTLVNKQFKQAWERPNLVYVETQYPTSELTSGYKADKAKKAVGRHDWNGGELILSRYDKPVRIVPWEEVADDWMKELGERGVEFDIVPPKLLPILVERGMKILPPHKGMGKECNEAYQRFLNEQPSAAASGNVRMRRKKGEVDTSSEAYDEFYAMSGELSKGLRAAVMEAKRTLMPKSASETENIKASEGAFKANDTDAQAFPVYTNSNADQIFEISRNGDKIQDDDIELGGRAISGLALDEQIDGMLNIDSKQAVGADVYEAMWPKLKRALENFIRDAHNLAARLEDGEMKDLVKSKIEEAKYALDYYKRLANGEDVVKKGWRRPVFRRSNGQFVSSERDAKVKDAIEETAKSIGGKVRIISDTRSVRNPNVRRMLDEGRGIAYYDVDADEVVIYLPNVTDEDDARRTVLHEMLGHKGLRQVYGKERFDKKMHQLFASLPKDDKMRVWRIAEQLRAEDRAAAKPLLAEKRAYLAEAMDEYLAECAEEYEPADIPWWGRVIAMVKDMLRDLGINVKMTRDDITYMLWRSANALKQGKTPWEKPLRDVKMQKKYGTGLFDTNRYDPDDDPTDPSPNGGGGNGRVRFRRRDKKADRSIAGQYYNENARTLRLKPEGLSILRPKESLRNMWDAIEQFFSHSSLNYIDEAWHDYRRSLNILQTAVTKESGKPILDSQNVYMQHIALSSKNHEESERLMRRRVEPLFNFVADLFSRKDTNKDELEKYLIAVHGPERNEVFAKRDADRAVADMADTDPDKPAAWAAAYAKFRKQDYSGLTETFREDGDPDKGADIATLEARAAQYATEYEARIGDADINTLWDMVDGLAEETLKKAYTTGMTSKDTYEKTKTQFTHYVPLRGWDEEAAGDVYEYADEVERKEATQQTIKNAFGRKSRAGDILETMAAMAHSAILVGNKNVVKQALLRLAEGHRTPLMTVTRMWFVKDPSVSGAWMAAVLPDDASDPIFVGKPYEGKSWDEMDTDEKADFTSTWEESMKALKAAGDAKETSIGLKLSRPITDAQMHQHQVRVMRNGKQYVVNINGAPNAAQAVNELLNVEANKKSPAERVIAWANRNLARAYTSWNPEFLFRNVQRDMLSAANVSAIKYGKDYVQQLRKNIKELTIGLSFLSDRYRDKARAATGIGGLYNLYNNDRIDESVEMERYFKEFMENGGETGYSHLWNVKDFEKQLKDASSKARRGAVGKKVGKVADMIVMVGSGVQWLNRCFENVTRFAVYMTSRQQGKSILQSINDAKEASTNFNKKGSGALGNRWFRDMFTFMNASIQGTMRYYALLRNTDEHSFNLNKMGGKALASLVITFMMGAINTVTQAMLAAMLVGDDDDEPMEEWDNPYWRISSFRRRNALVVGSGMRGGALGTLVGYVAGGKKGALLGAAAGYGAGVGMEKLGVGTNDALYYNLGVEEAAIYGCGAIVGEKMLGHGRMEDMPGEILSQLFRMVPLLDGLDPSRMKHETMEQLVSDVSSHIIGTFPKILIDAFFTNLDYMGKDIANRNDFTNGRPEYTRVRRDTPEFEIEHSKWLYDHWGWDLNPNIADYIVRNIFGGAYQFPVKVLDAFTRLRDGQTLSAEQKPILSTILQSTDQDWQLEREPHRQFFSYKYDIDRIDMGIKDIARRKNEGEKEEDYAALKERLMNDDDYPMWKLWQNPKFKKAYDSAKKKGDTRSADKIIRLFLKTLERMEEQQDENEKEE